MNFIAFKALKYLSIVVLLTVAACAPAEHQNYQISSPTASLIPAYPVNTPYLEPAQSPTAPSLGKPIQLSTLTPSPPPSPLPSATISATRQALANSRMAQLKMFDANTGWAVQRYPNGPLSENKILHTTNSLGSWVNVTPPGPEGFYVDLTASFFDANNAMVLYNWQALPTSNTSEITTWRTHDGGHTWQAGEKMPSHPYTIERFSLMMLDANQGWLLGIGAPAMGNATVQLFETRNGGLNWEMVYDTSHNISDPNGLWVENFYPYEKIFRFLPNQSGFFSNGSLFSSPDGGRSWKRRSLDPPAGFPDIDCMSIGCKYLNVVSAPEFTSSQAGVLLRRVYLNSEEVRNSLMYGADLGQLPEAQFLYFTRDGGKTWVPRPLPVKIGTAYFMNGQTGWLLGKNDPDPTTATQLYQTTNAGETWTQISADCPLPIGGKLQFLDGQTGFAFYPLSDVVYYRYFDDRLLEAVDKSILFYTKDGGYSWDKVEPQIAP
jgi:photosystem II stability/assembly factor-like uncharacterized protein